MKFREEIIGDCRLILGDSREIINHLDIVPDCLITDPPYGMAFVSNYRETKHMPIQNDEDNKMLQWAISIAANHSKYIFCRWDNLSGVKKPKSILTWVKNNHSMGDLEHEHGRQTELILFYSEQKHFFPGKRPTDIIFCDRTGNNLHPTEKPVSLMEVIVSYTAGAVLDPFMGAGSTGIACAKLKRKFIGIELEEKYFDIACRRIEEAYKQPDMFIQPTVKHIQDKLI